MQFLTNTGIGLSRSNDDGTIRIGWTRISLDIVVREYLAGQRPEEIQRAYPSLNLADVYGAIAFYLYHKPHIDQYLAFREKEALALRERAEAGRGGVKLKDRLKERLQERERGGGDAGAAD